MNEQAMRDELIARLKSAAESHRSAGEGIWEILNDGRNYEPDEPQGLADDLISDADLFAEAAIALASRADAVSAPSPISGVRNWHCQNGGDVCLAGNKDGVCCPDESCDIDDGVRKSPVGVSPVGASERAAPGTTWNAECLSKSIEELDALGFADDRGLDMSEQESIGCVVDAIRQLLAFAAAQPTAPIVAVTDAAPVTDDEVIELAVAIEQQRALKIVADVRALRLGKGLDPMMPTVAESHFDLACEEIEIRLRTEQWTLDGVDMPLPAAEQSVSPEAVAWRVRSKGTLANGNPIPWFEATKEMYESSVGSDVWEAERLGVITDTPQSKEAT